MLNAGEISHEAISGEVETNELLQPEEHPRNLVGESTVLQVETKALLEAGTTETSQPPLLKLEANSSPITDIPGVVKSLHEKARVKSEGLYGRNSSPSARRPCFGWISEEED
ncbi:hypothetical protein KSP39_PZI024404 [Platanthera zijinensis]|uniref:Uncharacterized protein n=1 Tax=Platanthera zijinensis TaxID=2320716 RepID=A0AAP0AS19_9ASPA